MQLMVAALDTVLADPGPVSVMAQVPANAVGAPAPIINAASELDASRRRNLELTHRALEARPIPDRLNVCAAPRVSPWPFRLIAE
jgi:hypothetical protein